MDSGSLLFTVRASRFVGVVCRGHRPTSNSTKIPSLVLDAHLWTRLCNGSTSSPSSVQFKGGPGHADWVSSIWYTVETRFDTHTHTHTHTMWLHGSDPVRLAWQWSQAAKSNSQACSRCYLFLPMLLWHPRRLSAGQAIRNDVFVFTRLRLSRLLNNRCCLLELSVHKDCIRLVGTAGGVCGGGGGGGDQGTFEWLGLNSSSQALRLTKTGLAGRPSRATTLERPWRPDLAKATEARELVSATC